PGPAAVQTKVPCPALDMPLNSTWPPWSVAEPQQIEPLFVKNVESPATALPLKEITPCCSRSSTSVTKFCTTPELLVIPVPLIVNVCPGLLVTVKALASAVNVTALTSVPAEIETEVGLEASKVAVSLGPFDTVGGVQLAAVFQSALTGLSFQVALSAWALVPTQTARMGSNRMT